MKTSTSLLTLTALLLSSYASAQSSDPSDPNGATSYALTAVSDVAAFYSAEGFNGGAASYLATALLSNSDLNSAYEYIGTDTAVQAAAATFTQNPTDGAAILSDAQAALTIATGLPATQRAGLSSVLAQAQSLQSAGVVSSEASSIAASASSAAQSAGSAASSKAAAPKQTAAVGMMGAVLAGVAGVAVAL